MGLRFAEGAAICRRVRKIKKSDTSCLSVCLSVCPHGTTGLPLEGFSRNLILECFSKICRNNSSFIKI
jgi:hypothetical protein